MTQAKHPDIIKHFAQDLLGCNCPEEVFDSIVSFSRTINEFSHHPVQEFIIGSRLLIYITTIPEDELERYAFIEELTAEGRRERDTNRFNRFRLVIIRRHEAIQTAQIHSFFNNLDTVDDRVHLHIFTETEVPKELTFLP